MSTLRILGIVGSSVAIVAPLAYITNSAASGWEYLIAIPFAWLGFGFTMGLVAVGVMLAFLTLELLLIWLQEEHRESVYKVLRWVVVVLGTSFVWIWGGQLIVDGLRDNRLVDRQTLYDRCMMPVSRVISEEIRECADGWASPSIGQRGACSHHGGVVRRWIDRKKTFQNDPAFCRADAAKRSWID